MVCVNHEASTFVLSYDEDQTMPLASSISASNLQTELNYLQSIGEAGQASVILEQADTARRCYRVTFEFNEPENTFKLREVLQMGQNSYVTITTDKPGTSSGEMYRLSFRGKRSSPIYKDSTEEEIMESIKPLFTTECEYSQDPGKKSFWNDLNFDQVESHSKITWVSNQ